MPGLLGSRIHFQKQFSDPVEHGQKHTATKRELATGRRAMRRLAARMSGCLLRRTKALISGQLPKKEDRVRAAFVCVINFCHILLFLLEKFLFKRKSVSGILYCNFVLLFLWKKFVICKISGNVVSPVVFLTLLICWLLIC